MGPLRLAAVALLVFVELAFAALLLRGFVRVNVAEWCSTKLLPLLRRGLRGCGQSAEEDLDADPDARSRAEVLLAERAVSFSRRLIFGASLVLFIRTLAAIVEIFAGGFAAGNNDRALFIVAYGQAVAVLGSCCPWLVVRGTLWAWHWLLMLMLIGIMSPWGIGAIAVRSPFYGLMVHMGSILFGLVGIGASSALLSNALLVASVYANVASQENAEHAGNVLVTECVGYAFKMALVISIHSMSRHSTQQEVLVCTQTCHRLAMSSLLDLICDAVVELDDQLLMTGHCPKLGNMLMHRPGRSLSGAALADFTVEEGGRESFGESVHRNTLGQDGVSLAGMFTGDMRDSMGNRLGVVFYHAPYTTVAGSIHHLVGIQERDVDAPRGGAGGRVAESGPGDDPLEGLPLPSEAGRELPEAVLRDVIARQVGRRHRSGRSIGSGSSSTSSGSSGGKAITVDVFATDGLPIRGADEDFHTSLGLESRARHFLDAVPDGDVGAELAVWIHSRVEEVESGALPAPHVETFAEEVPVGPSCRRRLRVLFPPKEPYCVSLRLERRGRRGQDRTVGRGTSASQEPEGLGPVAAPQASVRMSI